jgi:hypothetical protein
MTGNFTEVDSQARLIPASDPRLGVGLRHHESVAEDDRLNWKLAEDDRSD